MEERITQGISVQLTDTGGFTEAVSLAEVKGFLNMDFSAHDATLNLLIPSCREVFEQMNNVSLINKTVIAAWLSLYDNEPLPFGPITTALELITVKDLDNVVISATDYKIRGLGGFLYLVGDFPKGVKVSYSAGYAVVKKSHKAAIIGAVAQVFVEKISIVDAIKNHSLNVVL